MKVFANIMKILTALATVAGAIYIVATYGEQIVAWAKKLWASLPCPCCEEAAEEVAEEVAVEEVAVEEAPATEEAVEEPAAEEVAVEEVAEEAAPAVEEPVAEEADFEA